MFRRPLIIAYKNGAPVKLSQIANVFDSVEDEQLAAWVGQKPAVLLDIQRQPGANIIQTVVVHDRHRRPPFSRVRHQGQFPAVTISFNLDQGTSLDEATRIIEQAARAIHMPDDVRGSFQGTAQVFQDSLSSEPILILTAILAVYIVLGVLYESFIHPITILSTLPSAGLGALLALLVCQLSAPFSACLSRRFPELRADRQRETAHELLDAHPAFSFQLDVQQ